MASSFDTLPLDIHFQILSHLTEVSVGTGRFAKHSFFPLSKVSKTINNAVESYCQHLLQLNYTRYRDTKSSIPTPPFLSTKAQTYRQVYLTSAYRRCRYCNSSTKHVSSQDSSVRCCRRCDRQQCQLLAQWQHKINSSFAEREYGVPEATLLASVPYTLSGEVKLLNKKQVVEFATKYHNVDDIQTYINAKSEVCNRAQKSFMAESSRLWMERHVQLAVLHRCWRDELKELGLSEHDIGIEVQKRREEYHREWERMRDGAWSKRYPWFGNVDLENVEIYKCMKEMQEKGPQGVPDAVEILGNIWYQTTPPPLEADEDARGSSAESAQSGDEARPVSLVTQENQVSVDTCKALSKTGDNPNPTIDGKSKADLAQNSEITTNDAGKEHEDENTQAVH
ncbi:hypothetical protein BZA77DRAFT_305439 [Pyronema omphalodes]|nr:hypothetical protein BZA77DRAFT_305439 [Pyronema omphalodes]